MNGGQNMEAKINIKYNSESKEVSIECNGKYFDTSRLTGVDISEWAFPFLINSIRWFGLYNELKDFYGTESLFVVFHGSDSDLSIIKKAFEGQPVNVVGLNNKVIILYDNDKLTTKITVNGKIFDSTKLTNRSIDEWIHPFSFRDVKWNGIFHEIESFLGTDSYSIQFVGRSEDMNYLIDNCPNNINISYRAPVVSKKNNPPISTPSNIKTSDNQTQTNPTNKMQPIDYFTSKKGIKQLFSEIKIEYNQLKSQEANIHLFGIIACLTYIISSIICMIGYFTSLAFGSLYTLFIILDWIETFSFFAVIIYGIAAFLKGKKKLAICLFSLLLIFVGLKFMIESIYDEITTQKDLQEMDDALDDLDDFWDDIGEEKREANEAMRSLN